MFNSQYSKPWFSRFLCLLVLLVALPIHSAMANTIVRVTTSFGEFSIELFDDIAPVTVANFLVYVNSGRYDGTVIHRSEFNFVIQGGWLSFNEQAYSFDIVDTDPNIVNEFNISNTRGTLAMAKVDGDPDSANSQWFINLADNSFLDASNGGFTVFARVIEDGMTVVDAIAALPVSYLAASSPFPVINYTGGTVTNDHLVTIQMSVVEDVSDAPNTFDATTGLLNLIIDAGNAGLVSVSFSVLSTAPEAVIQALLNTVVGLPATVDKIATFDGATGRLTLPELVIDGAVAYRNVIFVLTDLEQLLFTLESLEQ